MMAKLRIAANWEVSVTSIWGVTPFDARVRIADVTLLAPSNGINWVHHASLIAAAPDMRAALEAQENAEKAHANCPDCDGIGDWAECGRCSELFGTAIDLRRAALAKAEGL